MSEFNENDITLEHERLADRSGYLRLIHRPSGLFVAARLTSQPVLKVKEELMEALRKKVLAQDLEQGRYSEHARSTHG
jgi:hypothetical protein